jgi:FixJ family two-component response regulator
MEHLNIYIVDDDEAFRKSLKRLLESSGYFAESFSSAQTFLDSVPVSHSKGIVILDIRMPGMDGFELQEKLKELHSELEIIFITADANPGDRGYAIQSGAVAFLQKPFQEESLLYYIRKIARETKATTMNNNKKIVQ